MALAQRPALGMLVAFSSALATSTNAVLVRTLTSGPRMPVLVLAAWKNVLAVLALAAALAVLRPRALRAPRGQLGFLAGYGALLAAFNLAWIRSVTLCGASVATVLSCSSCAMTALLGWWLLREPLERAKLSAVGLCLAGCVLVSDLPGAGRWRGGLDGLGMGLLVGLCSAAYSVMGRRAAERGIGPWTTLLYAYGLGTALELALIAAGAALPALGSRPQDLLGVGTSMPVWTALLLLAIVPTLLGMGLYNLSLVHLPSSVASLVVTVAPAFTAAVAWLFLGERLGARQLAGGLLLLGGVAALQLAPRPRIDRSPGTYRWAPLADRGCSRSQARTSPAFRSGGNTG